MNFPSITTEQLHLPLEAARDTFRLTFTRHSVHTETVAWTAAAHKTSQRVVTGMLAGSFLAGPAAFIHICTRCTGCQGLTSGLGWLKLVAVCSHSYCLTRLRKEFAKQGTIQQIFHTIKMMLVPAMRLLLCYVYSLAVLQHGSQEIDNWVFGVSSKVLCRWNVTWEAKCSLPLCQYSPPKQPPKVTLEGGELLRVVGAAMQWCCHGKGAGNCTNPRHTLAREGEKLLDATLYF